MVNMEMISGTEIFALQPNTTYYESYNSNIYEQEWNGWVKIEEIAENKSNQTNKSDEESP